jgi:uncharacterized membrane protein
MLWILLAISAYFLLALVELIDKQILSSPTIGPLTYAFYAGILTGLAFILWPLDFSFLSLSLTAIALLSGGTFFAGIYFLYSAIIKGEISRVVSIVGGLSPILIFIFSLLFLGEHFHPHSFTALLLLITGSILLSFVRNRNKFEFGKHFVLSAFMAAFFFAISYGLTKDVFLNTSFINGLIWIRVGTLICSLGVLVVPPFRREIFHGSRGFSSKLTALFLFDKGVSALAHVVLNYAIMLGSVAIVNALQAVEYAFIFVLTLGLSYFLPQICYESLAPKHLIPKMIGIGFVSAGVILLFLGGAYL